MDHPLDSPSSMLDSTPISSENDGATHEVSSVVANWWTVPPRAIVAEAEKAFYSELDQLLDAHDGKWVAYHGEKKLGFGNSRVELLAECVKSGIPMDDIAIFLIEPAMKNVDLECASPA